MIGIRMASTLAPGLLVACAAASAQPMYTVTPLGSLFGYGTQPNAINNAGQVVEHSYPYAFLYSDGVMSNLGTLEPGDDESYAYGINSLGQVVGSSAIDDDFGFRAVLWDERGVHDPGGLGGDGSSARGINDAGQIVGVSRVASGSRHAFLWQDGAMTNLGALPGSTPEAYLLTPVPEPRSLGIVVLVASLSLGAHIPGAQINKSSSGQKRQGQLHRFVNAIVLVLCLSSAFGNFPFDGVAVTNTITGRELSGAFYRAGKDKLFSVHDGPAKARILSINPVLPSGNPVLKEWTNGLTVIPPCCQAFHNQTTSSSNFRCDLNADGTIQWPSVGVGADRDIWRANLDASVSTTCP